MFTLLVVVYIVGGLTFVPLVALAAVAVAFYHSVPVELKPRKRFPAPDTDADAPPSSLKAWLTVRHTFEASPSSYISIVRTLLDARAARTRRAEDAYYAVLKRTVLYLYEDEAMSECAAAIDVRRCDVRIVPDAGLLDGELFAKRNAVLLRERDASIPATPGDTKLSLVPDSEKDKGADTSSPTPDAHAWYIFFRSAHDMEDWYFALLGAPAPFPHSAQRLLIDALDSLPDRIPTRWLNALIGRLFLGVKNTRALEDWVVGRLMKKLAKVKTPSWLTAVVVRSFDAGDVAPVLSKPMLKELTPEGEASVGVDVSYVAPQDGGIRITLSATATIALPAAPTLAMLGFKKDKDKEREADRERPYEVSLVLAVIVRRVEGNMLLKIKRAPSNRVWYAFTTMPSMDIEVTPVVSDRQIRWGMVLSGIEGKLREIIQDSVVLPNMDDIPFFDTSALANRGGIFADAFAAPDPQPGTPPDPQLPAELPAELRRARSAEGLVAVVGGGDAPAGPPDPDPEVLRAETIALGVRARTVSGSGSVRKRRTWFGGRRSEDSGDEGEGEGEAETNEEKDRNRVVHRRGHSEDASVVRVTVTNEDDSATGATRVAQDQDQDQDEAQTPLALRRPSSRSVSESYYASPPSPPMRSAGLSTSAPSTSMPSPTSSSSPSTPTGPSASFLAALKSRGAGMAEKQPAIKEAMRKWGVGVNWAAALRKGDSTRDRDRDRSPPEMEADHGDLWGGGEESPRRSTSPRGSYADLRRKVEERRERERTRPIDIPGAGAGDSSPRGTADHYQRRTGTDSDTSAPRVSPPAQFLSPSAPRTTTELHTAPRATSPTPSLSPARTPAPAPAPAPIRAQPPKAATMTIPGIHARHRGDVMGFGSVPPSPAPADASKGSRLLRGNSQNEQPPPLPPRTRTASADTEPAATLSPASQALKSVVQQDAAARVPQTPSRRSSQSPRTSLSEDASPPTPPPQTPASNGAGWKPPLPPRPRTVPAPQNDVE